MTRPRRLIQTTPATMRAPGVDTPFNGRGAGLATVGTRTHS